MGKTPSDSDEGGKPRRHPSSLANLRPPFPKGKSGNPGGRPRRCPISDSLAHQVEEDLPADVARAAGLPEGSTWADLLAKNTLRRAAKGDLSAFREIADRVEGRVRVPIEHSLDESAQQAMAPLKSMTQQDLRQGMLDMLTGLGHGPERAESLLRSILSEDGTAAPEQ